MVNRHNRLLVTFHLLSDATLAGVAFVAAYALRFHSGLIPALIPITRGIPPLRQYIVDLPFVLTLVPLGFQLQGLYRLRRGRSRVDDFFAVFVGTILAVVPRCTCRRISRRPRRKRAARSRCRSRCGASSSC